MALTNLQAEMTIWSVFLHESGYMVSKRVHLDNIISKCGPLRLCQKGAIDASFDIKDFPGIRSTLVPTASPSNRQIGFLGCDTQGQC